MFRRLVEKVGWRGAPRKLEGRDEQSVTIDYEALCENENGWKQVIDCCEEDESAKDSLEGNLVRWIRRLLEVRLKAIVPLKLCGLPLIRWLSGCFGM